MRIACFKVKCIDTKHNRIIWWQLRSKFLFKIAMYTLKNIGSQYYRKIGNFV